MSPAKTGMSAKEFSELLAASGFSQVAAAKRIGVHKQTVHHWLKNKRKIDIFKADRIRKVLK